MEWDKNFVSEYSAEIPRENISSVEDLAYVFDKRKVFGNYTIYFSHLRTGHTFYSEGSRVNYAIEPPSASESSLEFCAENSSKFTSFRYSNWFHAAVSGYGDTEVFLEGAWQSSNLYKENFVNIRNDGWAIVHDCPYRVTWNNYVAFCIKPNEPLSENIRYDYHRGTSFRTKRCNTNIKLGHLFKVTSNSVSMEEYNCTVNNEVVSEEECLFITMVNYG